jgi:hypothetical protein
MDEMLAKKADGFSVVANGQEQIITLPFYVFLKVVTKKWKKIAAFVIGVTALAAILFLLILPRNFEAEGYLQVIPLPSTADVKNDFEAAILSHLSKIQSAYTADEASKFLKQKYNLNIDNLKLQKLVTINRPPKSNLIRIVARTCISQEAAQLIVTAWIERYLAIAQQNNINTALFNIRNSIRQCQTLINNQQGKVNELRNQAAKISPLITVTRSIDETELWRILVDKPTKETLKSAEDLKIKGEEESKEYIAMKTMLYDAEQQLASAKNNLTILQEVEKILQMKSAGVDMPSSTSFSSNAVEMAETLIKTSDIIPVGQPALLKSKRGILMYTLMVFVGSAVMAFLIVYLREFYKIADTYIVKKV